MFRNTYFPLFIFFLSNPIVLSQNGQYVTLNSAHIATIQSEIVENMEYELCIGLPEGYNDTTLMYPVVNMLDGYEIFGLQLQTYQQLVYHNHVPKLILVGINYIFEDKDFYSGLTDYEYIRFRDYTPTHMSQKELIENYGKKYASYVKESGGSANFLKCMQQEIIPYIESKYRADPKDRCILGYSQAGLFTTYVLFHSPETFQRIFIGSPALWWDDEIVFEYYDDKNYENLKYPVKVYLSIGELEGKWLQDSYSKLIAFLKEKQNPNIELISEILQGEKHLTGIGAAHSRAFWRLYGK